MFVINPKTNPIGLYTKISSVDLVLSKRIQLEEWIGVKPETLVEKLNILKKELKTTCSQKLNTSLQLNTPFSSL